MNKRSRYVIIFLIVFCFVGCDQATKSIAKRELQSSATVHLFGGLVRLQYAENEGAFLSIGSELPAIVRRGIAVFMTIIVLAGFIALLFSAPKIRPSSLISFSLLVAGSLGNLIDRLLNDGRVVDFLIFGTKTFHTGILNVADLLITTSVVLLFITELFRTRAT